MTDELEMIRNQNGGKGKTTALPCPRVTIVTMLPVNVIVPKLRQILVNQLAAGLPAAGGGLQNINALVKQCLQNISISMVFDIQGLREVLGEIRGSLSSSSHHAAEEQMERHKQREKEQEQEQLPLEPQDGPEEASVEVEAAKSEPVVPMPIPSPTKPRPARFKTEILDSEDEGEFEDPGNATDSSSELSSPPASLPDDFEEYEKLRQDNTPPKRDEDMTETTRQSSINDNDNQTKPQADNMENRTREIGSNSDNTGQTQTPSENNEREPSVDIKYPSPPPPEENSRPTTSIAVQTSATPPPPDMILITHISALLNGLFTGRDKSAGHETVTILLSQLRQLTGHFGDLPNDCPGPLIMILNSTTASTSSSFTSTSVAMSGENNPNNLGEQRPASREQQSQTTTDSTLRSIFQHHHQNGSKTKPSFGMVFTQLLDLHLLCTRIPRRQRQMGPARMGIVKDRPPLSTARSGAGAEPGVGISSPSHRFAWVVEVLLDERGVHEYDFDDDTIAEERASTPERQAQIQIRRRCREQRWGAVEVEEGGGRIVDVVV